jgi:hypothetical protein
MLMAQTTIGPPDLPYLADIMFPRSILPQEKWGEIAKRYANGESLRKLAESNGVSYETIRQAIKKAVFWNQTAKPQIDLPQVMYDCLSFSKTSEPSTRESCSKSL